MLLQYNDAWKTVIKRGKSFVNVSALRTAGNDFCQFDINSGVSIVFTVLKMDAGPIIKQLVRKLNGDEKATDFLMEMFTLGSEELVKLLPDVFDGNVKTSTQDDNLATAAPKLSSADARIDFSETNANLAHNRLGLKSCGISICIL